MLPMIENNSNMQLEEIPYRLPSRLQTCYSNSRLAKSYTANISNRKETYYRRAQTSCSMNFVLGDEQIKRPVNSCIDKIKLEISPQIFSHLNNELSERSLIDQNRALSLYKQTGNNINFKEELSEILYSDGKPIWISELKMWINENTLQYDFLKLSNTATLHENKLWKELSAKIAKLKERNKFQRKSMQIDKSKETNHHFKIFNVESPKKNVKINSNLSPSNKIKINKKRISTNEHVEIKENEFLPMKLQEFNEEIIPNLLDFESQHINENSLSYNSPENSAKEKRKHSESNEIKNVDKNYINEIKGNTERNTLKDDYFDENERLQTSNEESYIDSSSHDEIHISLTNQCVEDLQLSNIISNSSTNYPLNEIAISNNPNENLPIQLKDSNPLYSQKLRKNSSLNIRLKQRKNPFENLLIKTHTINSVVNIVKNKTKIEFQSDLENENEFIDEIVEKTLNDNNNAAEISELPDLPIYSENNKDFDITDEKIDNNDSIRDKLAPLLTKQKLRWSIKKKDMRYLNDLENEKRAEERRLNFINLVNKVKNKKRKEIKILIPDDPRFESYGFLAKYCILEKFNVSLYRNTFDVCDEKKKQWLNKNELIMALRGVNSNLKDFDIDYLNMVMSTCNYNLKSGADFKLFAVLAALSVKIITINSWIKNTLGNPDFKTLEKKTYFCRKLWEINVDPITNTIPLRLLSIELKAGGVKDEHIEEINERLGWMKELNILDFLTYIPLFILIHSSILDNPLDMSQKL